ncbi:MAG: hypothetical protein OEN02_16410 [Gammaproteobacteria bacterium]|nr:hypothetical protein [Gammaproteobacteria bacterium]
MTTAIFSGTVIACDDYRLPEDQGEYFEKLSLPYRVPVGKTGVLLKKSRALPGDDQGCTVVDDFNGDGRDDFAGIFQYTGKQLRLNDWSLDVVILFSGADGIEHVIFPFAGQYDQRGELLLQYLAPRAPGELDLRPGKMRLDYPAVVSYRRGKPSVVYYWNGEQITQRAIGVDD